MSRVWIGLGGNRGERASLLGRAVDLLGARGVGVLRLSHAYESAPERSADGPAFLNAVLEGETELGPREVLDRLQRIEADLGRPRDHAPGPRTVDLDLLAYEDFVWDEPPALVLPHPRMHRRPFVLVPLCELDVHWRHPVLGRSASELLADLECERGQVRLHGPLPRGRAAAPAPTGA